MKQEKVITKKQQDGGYYAIKGFTYQFDKSILEIIKNKDCDVSIEQIQDIGVDDYYIQVKYKETQKYSPSKIRPAICQLLDCCSRCGNTKKFKLYCYFKNKNPQKVILTKEELDKILGAKEEKNYSEEQKINFIDNFILEFSNDFEKQFKEVIKTIKESFNLKTEEEAMTYHAIFKASLFDIAISKDPGKRVVNYKKIEGIICVKEKIIFDAAYLKYLKTERYLRYLKKEYFTFKRVNMPKKERLFIIEIDELIKNKDIIQIIFNIQYRYFKKDISPAPYICFLGINEKRISEIKQKLWDDRFIFCDGTYFNGDKFRIENLVIDTCGDNNCKVTFKFIAFEELSRFFKKIDIDETFLFSISEDKDFTLKTKEIKKFYVKDTKNIIKIIN